MLIMNLIFRGETMHGGFSAHLGITSFENFRILIKEKLNYFLFFPLCLSVELLFQMRVHFVVVFLIYCCKLLDYYYYLYFIMILLIAVDTVTTLALMTNEGGLPGVSVDLNMSYLKVIIYLISFSMT